MADDSTATMPGTGEAATGRGTGDPGGGAQDGPAPAAASEERACARG